MNTKYYYQILIVTPREDHLIYWIRDEKIQFNNRDELSKFIRDNLPNINQYKRIKEVISFEIPKTMFDDMERGSSNRQGYIVIRD